MKTPLNPDISSGQHKSFWTDTVNPLFFETLDHALVTDVVIVGGGMAGLSVGYQLSKEGLAVVIVEDGSIGSGESGRTTAHLVTALDNRYYTLNRMYGATATRKIAESHARAIDFIERAVAEESISCEFHRTQGYLFLHASDNPSSLDKEWEAARSAGIHVDRIDNMPGIFDDSPALVFPDQATFHPVKYMEGLSRAIVAKGGKIFTRTHAKEIDEQGIVTTAGHRVRASHVVVATNSPVSNKYSIHLKQYPYRTYVIGALVEKGALPPVLWWDTGDNELNSSLPPYHYVRTEPFDENHDLLICGGEDHPTGLTETPEENLYNRLETWAKARFPIKEIRYKWSGQVLEPMDGLAFIGRDPSGKDNMYMVTGDSGNGLTHAAIAGMLIPDLIQGKENPWEKLYNPSRFRLLRAGGTFFKELAGMTLNYYKSKPKDAASVQLSSIQPGTGKVVELDGNKYGAYADETGALHLVDAECTHLGCIIHWNNDEKTWDCPCHGSRFAVDGKVLNGPANSNLPYHRDGAHLHEEAASKTHAQAKK